jgi:hypothetical protein
MTSMLTTGVLALQVPGSTASPSINRMVCVNMVRAIWKATDGGLQHQ